MQLLHKSSFFASYQCDSGRCFYIDFGSRTVQMSFCQLLSLRQRLKNIDLESHFSSSSSGVEILCLCNRNHLFVFNTEEILDLQELLKISFGILELNSLVSATSLDLD